ncbi:trehalose synthase [Desulfocurvibacter africanus PCS]|uniref:maltose alpha-D-glucosyltransferase n=1 Tax=Desulfocurvibacter africanus PCS TaxID=1262666 RepID=M5PPM9_DESAF|nr:maltose alpha-D-glucosyltransferase [Desulfocurvibacter africanus]EMG35954.1 trehalose synthase [Desulfocurvibacter africanus PCS]
MPAKKRPFADDPLWYKDAVIYEVHIKSFRDSNGDGIGDFNGLTEKLDYLADLGVTAIWILPFYPSPLKDDGYDIADYYDVHPDYGTLDDFKRFLREAHSRGIRVITELVINHTSDKHAWFQRARLAPAGSKERNYYVWTDNPEHYKDARIIFKDFEPSNWSWDPVAKAYYWHRFYSHQPDLNFDNPQVRKEVLRALDFWLGMGVDGLRLDAIPYLYEREGTNCENLPETYAFLKHIRAHVDKRYKDRMLLAEANQWPEDAVEYFGDGDSCHMAFHFPVMPRMFMSLQMEDRFPIIDILDQTPEIPANAQWALFLRNHDELTLEMVTDEERDYMYRMYARERRARINLGIRRRLAPLLENDRRKIELMNVMLLTLPGSPVIYYGDELGMGDNFYLGDRDGVRTPMQWSADRNAGFSTANPQRLYLPIVIDPEYHYEAINVENQERNRSSLLWWTRNFLAVRKRFKAYGRGSIEFVLPTNPKVLAYVRRYAQEAVLVVINLSRHPQMASINLRNYKGCIPEEVFSRMPFPPVRDSTYVFTLNSYGYYIFSMEKEGEARLELEGPLECASLGAGSFLDTEIKASLERNVLPAYLQLRGWLGERAGQLTDCRILEAVPVGSPESPSWLVITEVSFLDGHPGNFNFVLSYAFDDKAARILDSQPQNVLCRFEHEGRRGMIFEGMHEEVLNTRFIGALLKRQRIKGHFGELSTTPGRDHQAIADLAASGLRATMSVTKRVNTNIVFGSQLFLKVFRRAEEGPNPDMEISRYLSDEVEFTHTPAFLGAMEYTRPGRDGITVALLKEYVHAESDAQAVCLDMIDRFMERLLAQRGGLGAPQIPDSPLALTSRDPTEHMRGLFSETDAEFFGLMGKRTAALHLALSQPTVDPNFAPEPFSKLYQRSVYQAARSDILRVVSAVESKLDELPEDMSNLVQAVLEGTEAVLDAIKGFYAERIDALKTRVHGDYHLAHLLYTGKDFLIIDFEGKPEKHVSQRRLKRSPLRDLADLQRSLYYTASSALTERPTVRPEDRAFLAPWVELWHQQAFGIFMDGYQWATEGAAFLPKEPRHREVMLRTYLLNKSYLELGRMLQTGTGRLELPMHAILRFVRWKV